jgi:hypothetical protein
MTTGNNQDGKAKDIQNGNKGTKMTGPPGTGELPLLRTLQHVQLTGGAGPHNKQTHRPAHPLGSPQWFKHITNKESNILLLPTTTQRTSREFQRKG